LKTITEKSVFVNTLAEQIPDWPDPSCKEIRRGQGPVKGALPIKILSHQPPHGDHMLVRWGVLRWHLPLSPL